MWVGLWMGATLWTNCTAAAWPMYVRMHLRVLKTSQILTLVSIPAESSRWPLPGNQRICETPLVCPDHVCSHFFGMKHSCSLSLTSGGAVIHERPW